MAHGGAPDPAVPNPLPPTSLTEPQALAAIAQQKQREANEAQQIDAARVTALATGNREPLYALRDQIAAQHEAEVRDFARASIIPRMEAIRTDMFAEQMRAHAAEISPLDGPGTPNHLRGGFPKHAQVGGTVTPPAPPPPAEGR